MARKKVDIEPVLKSWDEADQVMHRIGDVKKLIETKTARGNLRIDEIKAEMAGEIKPLDQELKQLERDLGEFSKSEYGKKAFSSKVLTFGSVFFRRSTSLTTLKKVKWEDVIGRLKKAGLTGQFLKVSESVKKDELRTSELTAEQLAELGVERKVEYPFKYEIDEEKFDKPEPTPTSSGQAER